MGDNFEAGVTEQGGGDGVVPVWGDTGLRYSEYIRAQVSDSFSPVCNARLKRATLSVGLEGGCPERVGAFEGHVVSNAGSGGNP